ncbi:MAG: sulfur carrier protein ThiS [Cyanobacteriota bacterium]|jgi:sulfur carrier protein|nr:sulfur carrier protein ThiS [Cyanobacteriota bacterium]
MISIRVNGELQACPAGIDLRAMLIHLGYQPDVVVVELNGVILSRSQWPGRPVVETDVIEVVTIVGGGT